MLCYVYVIATLNDDGWKGPCKVGISENPGARLLSLQSGNPMRIEIYMTAACPNHSAARKLERCIHEHFSRERLSGEWFAIDPEVAAIYVAAPTALILMDALNDLDRTREALGEVLQGAEPEKWLHSVLAMTDPVQASDAL